MLSLPRPAIITRRALAFSAAAAILAPKPALAAAHRYWRVLMPIGVLGGPGREYCTVAEMRMATTVGGANVCTGGTGIAGNTLGAYSASNAFDGNTGTFYSSNSGSANTVNNYIGYDFGSGNDKAIVDVFLDAYSTFGNDLPGWGIAQYSDDGSSWTSDFGMAAAIGTIGNNLAAGLTGGARYHRLLCTAAQSGNQIVIQEITAKTASGAGSGTFGLAFCARDISQDSYAGAYYTTGAAVVETSLNEWQSANTAGDHWVDFDFGAGNAPAITTLQLRSSYGGSYTSAPSACKWQISTDRASWVDVQSFNLATWTANNQLQTLTVSNPYPSPDARKRGHLWH